MRPFISKRKCYVQPDLCTVISICPTQAITYINDETEPLGGKILIDLDKCIGCGLCAKECCGEAIEMQ